MNLNCLLCIREQLYALQSVHAERGFNSSINEFALREYLLHLPLKTEIKCEHLFLENDFLEDEIIEYVGDMVVPLETHEFPLKSTEHERKIITLIGSTKQAKKIFPLANYILTCKGFIVLSIGYEGHDDNELFESNKMFASIEELNHLHRDKIAMSHVVYVLNPYVLLENGEFVDYVGEATGSEIQLARELDKELWWYNPHTCTKGCHCRFRE